MGAPQPNEHSEHGAEPIGAPQPEERDVNHDRVSQRASEDEHPVGPKSSLLKPMNIAMGVLVLLVLAWAVFGSGWILQ